MSPDQCRTSKTSTSFTTFCVALLRTWWMGMSSLSTRQSLWKCLAETVASTCDWKLTTGLPTQLFCLHSLASWRRQACHRLVTYTQNHIHYKSHLHQGGFFSFSRVKIPPWNLLKTNCSSCWALTCTRFPQMLTFPHHQLSEIKKSRLMWKRQVSPCCCRVMAAFFLQTELDS